MGNNSWMDSVLFSRHLVPQNVGNMICVCYFLNIVSNPNLPTSPKNQFRDYHAWNRIEKLMPQHCTNFLKLLKLYEKQPTCFQTLTFCRNLGFQNPEFVHGFSMDSPPPLLEFSGRPRERPTKNVGGAGAPPPRISRPGSLGRAL